jgi:hypothetical protein
MDPEMSIVDNWYSRVEGGSCMRVAWCYEAFVYLPFYHDDYLGNVGAREI